MKLNTKLGRPRIRQGKTKINSVRIDDHVKQILQKEFGGLSNALYYIYEGLQAFREQKNLPTVRATNEGMGSLNLKEIEMLIQALKNYIEFSGQMDGRRLRPHKSLLMKLLGRHPDGSRINHDYEANKR